MMITKLFLLVMLVFMVLKTVIRAIAKVFQLGQNRKDSKESFVSDWYGVCENCGKKDGLHRFQVKRYCARCYAQIKTEWDFAKKAKNDAPEN